MLQTLPDIFQALITSLFQALITSLFQALIIPLFQALVKYYDQVMTAILRHLNFDVVKAVVIASPGFVKDQFFEHMMKVSYVT